jgi:hypothetical protein
MSRRIAVITSVSLSLLLSVATLAILWRENGVSKITTSFVNAQTSYAAGPPLRNVECERLAIDVRNDGKTTVRFEVSDIKDEHGNWFQSFRFPSFQDPDEAAAGKTAHLYLYLPKDSHPQALRIRGSKKANTVEKAQNALTLLIGKIEGRYAGKQVWFETLSVPAYEFIVRMDIKAEPNATANQSQPVSSGTNLTSSAAGLGR